MTSAAIRSITAETAETHFATAAGVDLAYRRLGRGSEVPLVMLQHFRGNLDDWDPGLIDALATDREVIVVDNPGIGASTGEPDRTIAATARHMLDFIAALRLDGVDLLGRFLQRQDGRDAPTTDDAPDAQYDAIVEWGIPDHGALQRLTGIQSPTLLLQGDADLMIPPKVSRLMAGPIPNAEIRIHADAAHGFLFQYPADVARDVDAFLAQDHEEERS